MSLLDLILQRKALGWRPDAVDPRDYSHELLGLGAADPGERYYSLKGYAPRVITQGPTSSCVGQGCRYAITVCERRHVAGQVGAAPPEPPSARFIYYHGRRYDGSVALRDIGCTIRGACQGLSHAGVPDESLMPWSTININGEPSWRAYMGAYARRGGAYYRIFTPAGQRGAVVREAILQGHPVVFGAMVDKAFLENDGPDVIGALPPDAKRLGGHCLCIIGFNYNAILGCYTYEVINSWGEAWRADGYAYLTESFLASKDASAFTIIDGWLK